ncbi:hypothetical protein [Rhodoferax lacus]|nr:hypothetical protein [Rhodoferax lacus]
MSTRLAVRAHGVRRAPIVHADDVAPQHERHHRGSTTTEDDADETRP